MNVLIDEAGKRLYLIPEDLLIPPGSNTLQFLNGESIQANTDLLTAFEKTEAEIKAHLREKMHKAAEEAKTSLQMLQSLDPETPSQDILSDLFLKIMGTHSQELEDNPEKADKIREGIQAGILHALKNTDPDQLPEVELSVDIPEDFPIDVDSPEFRETAQKLGPSLDALLEDPESQASLERIFDAATRKIQEDPEKMKEFLEKMEALNEQVFGEQEKLDREQRAKDIRNAARDAIRESLLKRGITPLSENE